MDKQKSIQVLQAYATGLAAQSLQHKVQSKIFASQGLSNSFNIHDNGKDLRFQDPQ